MLMIQTSASRSTQKGREGEKRRRREFCVLITTDGSPTVLHRSFFLFIFAHTPMHCLADSLQCLCAECCCVRDIGEIEALCKNQLDPADNYATEMTQNSKETEAAAAAEADVEVQDASNNNAAIESEKMITDLALVLANHVTSVVAAAGLYLQPS